MVDIPKTVPRMASDLSDSAAKKYENLLAAVDPDNEVVIVDEDQEEEKPTEDELETEPDAEESESDEESEEEESAESSGEEEATDEPEAEATGETLTLPAAHVRSLKAYGWDDDEIAAAVEKLGTEFFPTAAKIHANRIAESQQWAANGRAYREQQTTEQDTAQRTRSSESAEPESLKRVDVEALKKEYGDDELISNLIDRMSGPMNSAIEALNTLIPQASESAARTQRSEEAGLARQVEQFFGSEEMKAYETLYGGADTNSVTEPQWQARAAVLQQADALQVGAGYQHRQLELTEALELAHDSVASQFKTDAIRSEIKGKVKKRTKSITLKPSKKVSMKSTGKPGDRTEMIARTTQRLAKVFGGN